MPKNVTSIEGDKENCAYERISLQYSHTWPGEVYLRFEPFGKGPATMIRVLPGDIVSISRLGDPYVPDEEVRDKILRELADMDPDQRATLLSKHRHPSGR